MTPGKWSGMVKVQSGVCGANLLAQRLDCLLLMIELMNSNQEIQKIVAFEGVFECIFQIISDEGGSNGGIVVIDCLRLMQILLHNNTSNQVCCAQLHFMFTVLSCRTTFEKLDVFNGCVRCLN